MFLVVVVVVVAVVVAVAVAVAVVVVAGVVVLSHLQTTDVVLVLLCPRHSRARNSSEPRTMWPRA